MRYPFTDGWNSFFHLFFGFWGTASPIVFILFLAYQLIDPSEMNVMIDLTEFLVGYWISYFLTSDVYRNRREDP
jgi:hypothetical protein